MRPTSWLRHAAALALATGLVAASAGTASAAPTVRQLPANATFDYQIGGDHAPAGGVRVVSRDWFVGSTLKSADAYSICYVNAYQTQADEAGVQRPDERSAWPSDLVLASLGDDPQWGGEYLVDISTPAKRARAATWVAQMTDTCVRKGFDAVEFDNLDSWTRFDDTPLEGRVPFGRAQAVAFAKLLAQHAHEKGLAVGQKNTPQLRSRTSLGTVRFDFAVAEECGRYDECGDYTDVFGGRVVAIEYTDAGYRKACASAGSRIAVVRRDVGVSKPGGGAYRFATC